LVKGVEALTVDLPAAYFEYNVKTLPLDLLGDVQSNRAAIDDVLDGSSSTEV
jgi:hypothetical protein